MYLSLVLSLSLGQTPDAVDYVRDIKPILAKHCVVCHGPNKQKSDLRLDTAAGALRGGIAGPAIMPGKSESSRLIKAVTAAKGVVAMPPDERPRLSPKELALLKAWIDQGAKAPNDEVAVAAKKSEHWAFQAPKRAALPKAKNSSWIRNPIDRFILARLDKEELTPSPEADRTTLIRRLSLDLTGLPPTLKEVDEFLNDKRPDAYERVVDRLLASPHYGERWGRHWLDLARYADSNGFNIDAPRTIWPYRDWVIAALNKDLPFDQFVIHQLAGDLVPEPTLETRIATGFHRNTLLNQEGGIDLEQFRVESVVDRVNTTGAVFLGLTLGCAQCHDHKFDPISQREYYQLFAFFNSCDEPSLPLPTPEESRLLAKLRKEQSAVQELLKGLDNTSPAKQAAWERDLTPAVLLKFPEAIRNILDKPDYQRTTAEKQTLNKVLRAIDQTPQIVAGLADALPGGTLSAVQVSGHLSLALYRAHLETKLAELKKQEPKIVTTMVLHERKTPRETHVQIRGDFLRKGRVVLPAVPEAMPGLKDDKGQLNRLDLARWLVSDQNPLTPRVFVNRVWQQYFGLGLVETENDFGAQGTPPSHPELLDWLALEFMTPSSSKEDGLKNRPTKDNGAWSMKALHRLIVTSATYRQASKVRPELANANARNRLLARQSRLRLEAEVVRDVALASSGLLNPKLGGPSVFPPQPDGVFAFTQVQREWQASAGPDRYRRGMYTYFWRSAPYPAMMAFDAPESTATCTRRNRSNTPLQALTLLNDKAFFEFAQGLAVRVLKDGPESDADRLRFAFRLCLAREPSAKELKRLSELLVTLERELGKDEAGKIAPSQLPHGITPIRAAAWTLVSRVLLNLDEFITRE